MTTIHLETGSSTLHPVVYKAADPLSESLLMHCAEGLIAVTPEYWTERVRPVIVAHGWEWEIKVPALEPIPQPPQ